MKLPYEIHRIHAIQARYFRAHDAVRRARPKAVKLKRAFGVAEGAVRRATERLEKAAEELKALGIDPHRRGFVADLTRPGWTILDVSDDKAKETQAAVLPIRRPTEGTGTASTQLAATRRIGAQANRRYTPGVRGVSKLRLNG